MSSLVNPRPQTRPKRPPVRKVPTPPLASPRRRLRRRRVVWAAVLLAIGTTIVAIVQWQTGGVRTNRELVLYPVRRGALDITVTERGNLESQSNIEVMCEVDDIRGDSINGTPILWIIDNGASVKKGDLIVELDSTNHQDRLDQQVLASEAAKAEFIQAQASYQNQEDQNATSLAEANLKVQLAELALKQFEDEEGGTFQIELQGIELQIQEAQAQQLIAQTNLEGVEQLYKLGYRSAGELAQARLQSLQAERQLATIISKKKELVEYTYRQTKMELEGALASARRAYSQVQRDNEADLIQAKARMEAAQESLKKEKELLTRYREQLGKCKIYAPQDGMVAYATGSRYHREEIRPGAPVRPQQTILSLPDLTRMQVKTAVHESVLDQIEPGLKATIRVDAFSDKTFSGTIQSVAVLPDPGGWLSSDTKVYDTIVTIDEKVEQLKPGMTAVVDIHVDRLENVLTVPVQSVVQIGKETWVYVDEQGEPKRRDVEVGPTNMKFVQIREGIAAGDRVVLNPTAVLEAEADEKGANELDRSSDPNDNKSRPLSLAGL